MSSGMMCMPCGQARGGGRRVSVARNVLKCRHAIPQPTTREPSVLLSASSASKLVLVAFRKAVKPRSVGASTVPLKSGSASWSKSPAVSAADLNCGAASKHAGMHGHVGSMWRCAQGLDKPSPTSAPASGTERRQSHPPQSPAGTPAHEHLRVRIGRDAITARVHDASSLHMRAHAHLEPKSSPPRPEALQRSKSRRLHALLHAAAP